MSKTTLRSRKSPFYRTLLLVLAGAVIAATAWSVSSSSALAPISSLNNMVTPTHGEFYGHAEIAKPAHTTLPTLVIPSPTFIPTENPINTPELMTYAEIIADTPTPQYATPAVEGSSEQTHAAAPGYAGSKHILIHVSEQHMYAYEGDLLVYSFIASTGMNNATRVGSFSVLNKIPNAYGETWNIWMPNWLGIYWSGNLQNGIHALPILSNGAQLWAGYLGTPISFGCIVIGTYESQLLYDWAEIGTPVEIQW